MVDLNRYKESETEWFNYVVEASQTGGLSGDTIIIGNELPQSEAKLAFSAGLSRSVKLGSLETKLHLHIDKVFEMKRIILEPRYPRIFAQREETSDLTICYSEESWRVIFAKRTC
jgi:uncharacterized Rmd1/YagE family protein